MRATIIVRRQDRQRTIVQLVEITNLSEQSVCEAVSRLRARYDESRYTIDTSQIEFARQAVAA